MRITLSSVLSEPLRGEKQAKSPVRGQAPGDMTPIGAQALRMVPGCRSGLFLGGSRVECVADCLRKCDGGRLRAGVTTCPLNV
jgi:hypothetical protein